jgi:guanylate kinase
MEYNYLITILVGMSACGKSAIRDALVKEREFTKVVTCTTRNPREKEKNGVDYFFLSKPTFEMNIKNNNFIEYSKTGNNYYGTLKQEFDKYNHYVIVLDINGAKNFSNYIGRDKCNIVYVYCSKGVRKRRMIQRGDFDNWNNRLESDVIQFTDENVNSICNMQLFNTGNHTVMQSVKELLGENKK